MSNTVRDNARRTLLLKLTTVVAGAGVAATAVPFVASMNPSSDVLAQAEVEVDLSGISLGAVHTVAWQGQPVFIVRRTPQQIATAAASNGGSDPEPDSKRALNPEWLVVVGVCTHMGCVPNKEALGWVCHCHGSQYDESGRVTLGPAPTNLVIPPYRFVGNDKIIIGKA